MYKSQLFFLKIVSFILRKHNTDQTFTNRNCFEIRLDYRTPLEIN